MSGHIKLVLLCLLLLMSCQSVEYIPLTPDVPSLPEAEEGLSTDDLIEEPETVYDLLHNSVVYEHLYYLWHDYSQILLDYIKDIGEVYKPLTKT